MKLIFAFLRLIRWQNLVIIAVTQVLYYYALIHPIHSNHQNVYDPFTGTYFILLIISSLMIAAAGNIINDYFDLNIDEVNKPQKKSLINISRGDGLLCFIYVYRFWVSPSVFISIIKHPFFGWGFQIWLAPYCYLHTASA